MVKLKEKIVETTNQLEKLRKQKRKQDNSEWNKEADKFVKENLGGIYVNNLVFPDSNEKVEYWVYKVAGLNKSDSPYEILMHRIYVSDRSVSIELNQRTYSSCPYIGHGIKGANKKVWNEALKCVLNKLKVN